jgi:hypothetical protein
LDRPIEELIKSAGLEIVTIEVGYGEGARPLSLRYRGRAPAGYRSLAAVSAGLSERAL